MPELIKHIDAIARQWRRDVLYLEFHPRERAARRAYRYEDDTVRRSLLGWLAAHGHDWQRCGPYAQPGSMQRYQGQVCLDVAFDENLPKYQQLRDHLEFPNGNMRLVGVRFCLLTLQTAMENAEHDAPGFWSRWADQF